MSKKEKNKKQFFDKFLAFAAYSFPIWYIIGAIPWAYIVKFDTEIWWKLVWFQICGLIGMIGSGIAFIKRK